jgi:molybdopterin-guanine dinucleotide biosynthesis protein A
MELETMQLTDVATSKAKLMVYLDPDAKDDLEKLAEANNRSMSNFVETLVMQAIDVAKKEGVIQ